MLVLVFCYLVFIEMFYDLTYHIPYIRNSYTAVVRQQIVY